MNALLYPFVAIDALAQRLFNDLFFALMRAGVSKAAIRHALTTAMGATIAGQVIAWWPYEAQHPGGLIAEVCCVAYWIFSAEVTARSDRRAESAGMISPADAAPGLRAMKVMAWAWLVLIVFGWGGHHDVEAVVPPRLFVVGRWMDHANDVAFFLLSYLAKTPPRPPAIRRRVLVSARGEA